MMADIFMIYNQKLASMWRELEIPFVNSR